MAGLRLCIAALAPLLALATTHDLTISSDSRRLFKIEAFCFAVGGKMEVTVGGVRFANAGDGERAGFLMVRAKSESAAQQDLENAYETSSCLLDRTDGTIDVLDMTGAEGAEQSMSHTIGEDEAGLYSLIFTRCAPLEADGTPAATVDGLSLDVPRVSFRMEAAFVNPGPDYLSACEKPLPSLYFYFCLANLAALVAWVAALCTKTGTKVHKLHFMMAALLVLKVGTLLSESIRYRAISETGSGEAWSYVYYTLSGLKGVMLFVVILLIGTGYSLVKQHLSDREKKIILGVLVLQVVDNVAIAVLEETAPGSQAWLNWRDLFHLIDIVCCCAILFPIVWSIRHLRQSAGTDGKKLDSVKKLTLFRQFYIMVVTYVYFTRIIVYLLAATLPWDLLWLRHFFTEAATFVFYTVTGYKFRPREANPYLPISREDDLTLDEFGLEMDDEDEGLELGESSVARV